MTTSTSSSPTTTTTSSSIDPNLLMGSKLRQHYQQNFREHVSAPTSAFAKKQLEKMGWTEGTGLGKKRDGIKSHIKVKKRKDELGLGASEKPEVVQASEAMGEWWKEGLGDTLARLSSKKKKKKSKKKDKKSKKTYTDEELFQATGGTRFGMRAGITNNLHKWVRTENAHGAENPSDAAESSSDAPDKAPAVVVTEESSEEPKEEKKKRKKDSKKRKLEATEDQVAENDSNDAGNDDQKKSKKDKKKRKKQKLLLEKDDTKGSSGESKKSRKEKKVKKPKKEKRSKD